MYNVMDMSSPQARESVFNSYKIIKQSPNIWKINGIGTGATYTYLLTFHSVDEWSLACLDEPNWIVRFIVKPAGLTIGWAQVGGRKYADERYLKKYVHMCMVAWLFIKGNYCRL